MVKFNFENFVKVSGVFDYKDVCQCFQMTNRYRVLSNHVVDPTYVPSFAEIEEGGIQVLTEKAAVSLVNKMTWLNTQAKSNTRIPIIMGYVDKTNISQVFELANSFIEAIDAAVMCA